MRLANQYETFLRSMVLLRGDQVSADQMGNIVDRAVASASPEERRNPIPSPDAISRLQQFLSQATETGRPRNMYGAEAARAAQAVGGNSNRDGAGFGYIDALRGSSARYRDLPANDGGESGSSGSGRSRGDGNAAASGTSSEPAGAAFWGTAKGMLLTRSYANDNDMGWAPTDLMKMGRPALQALKQSGLKGDGYKALRKPSGLNFDNPTVVSGAEYMRRNGCNYNEAAHSSAEVDGLTMPDEMRRRHRAAVQGVLTSTPENQRQRQEALQKSGDEIGEHDPSYKGAVERERRGFKVDQGVVPKAKAEAKSDAIMAQQRDKSADAKDKGADAKDKGADAKDKGADAKDAKATKTKSQLLSLYN